MEGALENSLFRQINSLIHVWKLPVLRDASVGMLDMELLPKDANFVRAKTLWEIGLHLAGNPATPYGGNRDTVITISSGSGAVFRPWLCRAAISGIEGLTRSGRVWRGRTPARNWT